MAKLECELQGDFQSDFISWRISYQWQHLSQSGRKKRFCSGSAYCAVRVYERYSFTGGNRVSPEPYFCKAAASFLSAITSGKPSGFSGKLISLVKKRADTVRRPLKTILYNISPCFIEWRLEI